MFICDKCLEAKYGNIGIFKSYGACELCDEVHNCNDIPTKALYPKTEKLYIRGADGTYYPTAEGWKRQGVKLINIRWG